MTEARATTWLPRLNFRTEVPVEVYLLHTGPQPEDYEILCDFERFLAENRQGFLARPALHIWAGRDDFARIRFARRLREAFTEQFELVRLGFENQIAEAARPRRTGLLPATIGEAVAGLLTAKVSLLSTVVLYLAVKAGGSAVEEMRGLLRNNRLTRALRGPSARARLEAEIESRKATIDAALAETRISLHRDLYIQAFRWGRPGPHTGVDFGDWPLPRFVQARLTRRIDG